MSMTDDIYLIDSNCVWLSLELRCVVILICYLNLQHMVEDLKCV